MGWFLIALNRNLCKSCIACFLWSLPSKQSQEIIKTLWKHVKSTNFKNSYNFQRNSAQIIFLMFLLPVTTLRFIYYILISVTIKACEVDSDKANTNPFKTLSFASNKRINQIKIAKEFLGMRLGNVWFCFNCSHWNGRNKKIEEEKV